MKVRLQNGFTLLPREVSQGFKFLSFVECSVVRYVCSKQNLIHHKTSIRQIAVKTNHSRKSVSMALSVLKRNNLISCRAINLSYFKPSINQEAFKELIEGRIKLGTRRAMKAEEVIHRIKLKREATQTGKLRPHSEESKSGKPVTLRTGNMVSHQGPKLANLSHPIEGKDQVIKEESTASGLVISSVLEESNRNEQHHQQQQDPDILMQETTPEIMHHDFNLIARSSKRNHKSRIESAGLTKARRKKLAELSKTRFKTRKCWRDYLLIIFESKFLMGTVKANFHATIDWILDEKNILKIMARKYDSYGTVSNKEQSRPPLTSEDQQRNEERVKAMILAAEQNTYAPMSYISQSYLKR